MKLNLRKAIWAIAFAITLTVFSVPNFAGAYQGYGRDRDEGRNDGYGRRGNLASQMGSEDGFNDGREDRATGHSNRPTQRGKYKDATRGFPGGRGETAYKAEYRQAYIQAYQQGYNEGRRGRR